MSVGIKSVDEARTSILAAVKPLARTETVRLEDAFNRVLAEDICATRDQPPFTTSSMDGYALRADDAPGKLKVVGESAAGGSLGRPLAKGEAARIFTGAPLPDGADSILIQEDAKRDGDWLETPAVEKAAWVRPQGMDFKSGAVLLPAGTRFDAISLALAGAAGAARFDVQARPRIALMSNGDEIVSPGTKPGPYQIFDSVSYGLTALVDGWGGVARRIEPVEDKIDVLAAAFEKALSESELLVTIGGASVGDHDLVKPALKKLGLDLKVDTVSVRPGKPVFFGLTRAGPVLGLPGNPASGLVCSHLFLRPLIEAMLGKRPLLTFATARLAAPIPENGNREHYLRARTQAGPDGATLVRPAESQDSSLLSIFRDSDALVRRKAGASQGDTGSVVEYLSLGRSMDISQ